MIRNLRRKFIWTNMLLVFIVLLCVFLAVLAGMYTKLELDGREAMIRALSMEGIPRRELDVFPEPGMRREPMNMVPVFVVVVDKEGKLLSYDSGQILNVSQEAAEQAARLAIESGETSGTLHDMGLRFEKRETPFNVRIAFADRSIEWETLRSLLLSSLLIGAGSLLAFFGISCLLAHLALVPVEKAWEQQRRFVADASHELKTPLTVILANAGILLSHRKDSVESQLKWVQHTMDEATRMKKLVDDLLFLAKTDAQNGAISKERISLSDAIYSGLLPFEALAYEAKVELAYDVESDVWIMANEAQMQQLTAILLDNACKYAGKGGEVRFSMKTEGDKAYIRCSNTGKCIEKEHMPHLFERFYRADSDRSRGKGGYGLGLSILKTIVDGHKGKVMVQSDKDAGTCFTVILPLK